MYLLARRSRDFEAMRAILEQMTLRRQCRDRIYVELSKLYEHRCRDYRRALRYADLAARYIPAREMEDLEKRRSRLRAKLEKQTGRKNQNGFF